MSASDTLIEIPCITLWMPWAFWVPMGWKTIETRLHARFAKLAGRRIGIHVGLKWDNDAIPAATPYLTPEQAEQSREFLRLGGHVICTAVVREARWLTAADSQAALIDCGSVRRFGLGLADIISVPVSDASCVTGRQGQFNVMLPERFIQPAGRGTAANGGTETR